MAPTRFAALFPQTAALDHAVRLLSTVAGTDKVLMVAQFGARLAASQLERKGSGSGNAIAKRLRNLANPIEDVRYVLRYYAILPMFQYSAYLENNPPSNPRLLFLERLQNICM